MPSPFRNTANKSTAVAPRPILRFKPSTYQQNIFDEVATGEGNILVNAVAGSGKSTTIEGCFLYCGREERVIAVAFNTSIARELQKRAPTGVEAATLNSVGWRTWQTFKRSEIDGRKIHKLTREVVPFVHRDESSTVSALVSKAKVHGLVPNNVKGVASVTGLMEDTDANWLAIAKRYDIELPYSYGRVVEYARSVLGRSITNTAILDFDDQLYMTIIYGVTFTKYDRVFVDETQDLSDIQMEMLKRMGGEKTRYVFVGDRRQSLYAFRGADSQAMDRIKTTFNCKELPLNFCYRCGTKIIEQAKKYEPVIEAAPGAEPGEVSAKGMYTAVDYQTGDLVLSRTNAPLMSLAYALIGRGKRVRIQGRDVAEGLKALIKKLKPSGPEDLLTKLVDWEQRQVSLLLAADEEDKVEALRDRTQCLRTIVEGSGAKSIPEVETAIDNLFGGEGPCILLSSVHRAKGLEADVVYVIDHHLTPRFAKTPEALEQEQNIKYVAVTRAKKALFFVTTR